MQRLIVSMEIENAGVMFDDGVPNLDAIAEALMSYVVQDVRMGAVGGVIRDVNGHRIGWFALDHGLPAPEGNPFA